MLDNEETAFRAENTCQSSFVCYFRHYPQRCDKHSLYTVLTHGSLLGSWLVWVVLINCNCFLEKCHNSGKRFHDACMSDTGIEFAFISTLFVVSSDEVQVDYIMEWI
jgi:putative component of membrane protein insertase Oxa1/YidC/SpoIIIJ protein YidD